MFDEYAYHAVLKQNLEWLREKVKRYPLYIDYQGKRFVFLTRSDLDEHYDELTRRLGLGDQLCLPF